MFQKLGLCSLSLALVLCDIAPVYQQNTPNGNIVIGGGNTFDTAWQGYQTGYNNYNTAQPNYNTVQPNYNGYNTATAFNSVGQAVASVPTYNGGYNAYSFGNVGTSYAPANNNFAPNYNSYNGYNYNVGYNGVNTPYNWNSFAPTYNAGRSLPPGYVTTPDGNYNNGPYGYFGPNTQKSTPTPCAHLAALRRQVPAPNSYNNNVGYNFNGFNNYGQYVPGGAWNSGFTNLAPTPSATANTPTPAPALNSAIDYRPSSNAMWNIVFAHGGTNGAIPGGGTAEENACQEHPSGPGPVPTIRWMGGVDSIYNGDFVVTNNPSSDINHGAGGNTEGNVNPNANYYFTNYIDPYTGQRGITWSPTNNWGNNGWTGSTPYVGDINGVPAVYEGLSQNNNGYTGWAGGGGAWMNDGAWKFNGVQGR